MNSNVSDQEIIDICKTARTMHEASALLGIGHEQFSNRAKSLGVYSPKEARKLNISLEEILEGKHPGYSTQNVKTRLLKSGIKEAKCEGCDAIEWKDYPLVFELHHKNHIRSDHRLENLKLLCPNCHRQEHYFLSLEKIDAEKIKEALALFNTHKEASEYLQMKPEHFRHCLKKLGLYELKRKCSKFEPWNTKSFEDIFSGKETISTKHLKIKLIKNKIKEGNCECCGIDTWRGIPLVCDLHHIDGNNKNNSLDNLEILCANCHSQTETYKNFNRNNIFLENQCACGAAIGRTSKACNKCKSSNVNLKSVGDHLFEWPPVEEIHQKLIELGWIKTAEFYGLPRSTIFRYLKVNGHETSAVKLRGKGHPIKPKQPKKIYYCECGKAKGTKYAEKCFECHLVTRVMPERINWPSCEELQQLMVEIGSGVLARQLEVTPGAIFARLRSKGYEYRLSVLRGNSSHIKLKK